VQDIYLAALEFNDSYCEKTSLLTWLVAILEHKTYDSYRKRTLERVKIGVLSKEPYLEMFAGD
jgi:DNA-directed RNA polymerase specialized sigma24 family protein